MNIKNHTVRVKRPPNKGATKQRKKDYDTEKSMKNIQSKFDTRVQWLTEFPEVSIDTPNL